MSQRTYAIVGCGAVGGYYGSCLQRGGAQVHFLVRSDYDAIRRHGLTVASKRGDFRLPKVNVYQDVASMPRCDVVVVALKTTQNHLLPQILPAILNEGGVVLMLQNGLGSEAHAASIVGAGRVLGGLCFVCCNKIGPGHIRHLDYGQVQLGVYQPQTPGGVACQWLEQIVLDFKPTGIPVTQVADLSSARWQKLVWNIPYNGLSVVLDATTQQIMADAHGRQLAQQLMEDVVAAARGCRSDVPEGLVQDMLDRTARMAPYSTSMKIDFDTKRPMEVEAIFGNPLRAALAAGIAVPQIRVLYEQLKFLDRRNVTGPAGPTGHPATARLRP